MSRSRPEDAITQLVREKVEFVLVGVFAINHYAPDPAAAFATQDCDVLLKATPGNLARAIRALKAAGYSLEVGGEPLLPDSLILQRLLEHRAVIRAIDPESIGIDLIFEAKGFSYEEWRRGRKLFKVGQVRVPVADLSQLIRSKELLGREKDKAFLALYKATVNERFRKIVRKPAKKKSKR